jgi:hypothetical protein
MKTSNNFKKNNIDEGIQQALRKYVPGYAKKQIDKKMDDQKFGRTDVDKDANYYRYKKIQDKLKKEEAEQIDEISLDLAKRARDKAEHMVDMDYDDLRDKPYGHSEKQRIKFQKYVDKKETKKNVKEEVELKEGHYEDAEDHMSKANDAHSQGDMLGYHSHMADHHDSMSQWHEEKGRGFHADKHAEKADMHADKMHDLAHGRMTESQSAEIRMHKALQKAKQDREKAEAEKERLKQIGQDFLNPVKKPAPMEPVKEEKEKTEYDYEGDMTRGQMRSIIVNAQFVHDMLKDNDNLPEWVQSKVTLAEDYISTVANYLVSEINEAKKMKGEDPCWDDYKMIGTKKKNGREVPNCVPESVEIEEGTFKYHMDKAIAADQKGDAKKKAYHLENARSAKFALKSSEYAKNRELLDKHKQMSEEIVHTRTGANGTKYHIKQESPNDFSVHREDNGKLKHIDTYGSLNRAKQVLDNEVKEAVVTEEKPGLYANIHAKRKRIAAGSGERMRKPGSKGAPTANAFKQAQKTVKENIDAGIDEGLARLISKSIKNVAAVKPSPQEKADIRLNKLNK